MHDYLPGKSIAPLLALLYALLLCSCAAPSAHLPSSTPEQPARTAAVPGAASASTPVPSQPSANDVTNVIPATPARAAVGCPDSAEIAGILVGTALHWYAIRVLGRFFTRDVAT